MTRFGEYLAKKSVNQSRLSKKIGVTRQRISDLCLKENSKPFAHEIYLIAYAMDVDVNEILEFMYSDLKKSITLE